MLLVAACCISAAACSASRARPAAPSDAPPIERLPPSLESLERRAVGERIELEHARLFVPAGFRVPADGRVPLVVHFQGGLVVAEENFARCGVPGVSVASTLSGLSSAFAAPYRDPSAFDSLLASAAAALSSGGGAQPVRFEPITITFFSAGYGAVRELLKHSPHFERIDALVSADSIYADVVAPDVRAAEASDMIDFMRFAQAAARGSKTFVVAHGMYPTDYASTAECADLLLASVGGRREPSGRLTERGVPIGSEAHVGNFHLYTFDEGAEGDEAGARIHMDCLYMIPELVRRHVR